MKGLNQHSDRINRIITIVAFETGISTPVLLSRSRRAPVVAARQISMWLSRWNTEASLQVIAHLHGCTNHANVIHGCSQVESYRKFDKSFRELTDRILSII